MDKFIDDKNTFINKVINTRNYLIHYDSASKSKAVGESEIHYIAERLKIILIAHILMQLGIPKENVYRDIKRFANFEYLKISREH
ncbi:MAG: HEPN domain-containing protein [Waterburya sp.]